MVSHYMAGKIVVGVMTIAQIIIDHQLQGLIRDLHSINRQDLAEKVWDIRKNLYREWEDEK